MEKEILLDQLDDRVKKGLALITVLYPRLLSGELEKEETSSLISILDGLKCFFKVITDVQYNGAIAKYRDDILNIAPKEL